MAAKTWRRHPRASPGGVTTQPELALGQGLGTESPPGSELTEQPALQLKEASGLPQWLHTATVSSGITTSGPGPLPPGQRVGRDRERGCPEQPHSQASGSWSWTPESTSLLAEGTRDRGLEASVRSPGPPWLWAQHGAPFLRSMSGARTSLPGLRAFPSASQVTRCTCWQDATPLIEE